MIMKAKSIQLSILGLGILACSCQEPQPEKNENNTDTVITIAEDKKEVAAFDIHSVPVSDQEVGDIPFFSLPENLMYQNKPLQRDYDELFFPLTEEGPLVKVEGKSFKSYITQAKNSSSDWSLPYFLKSYDDAIKSIGGVLVFDGKLTKEQLDYLKDNASYLGEEGAIDYWNEPVRVYVIRRAGGDDIYIQLYGNTASGAIQIVQKAPFKQTISILKSDEIKKSLAEKGKAVVHINFDVDKASLQQDGVEAIREIIQVAQDDPGLKLAIHGYTDNSGSPAHNKQLSEQRANTVKQEMEKAGIKADRLQAKGFGQEDPIADNSTEDGKAKNRRVELVKM